MKQQLFGLALGMVAMTACTSDDLVSTAPQNRTVTVSFDVTAASDIASRAVADGMTANRLAYVVFPAGGTTAYADEVITGAFAGGTTQTVDIPLVVGENYNIVFWADNTNSPYKLGTDGKVSIDYTTFKANSDECDAFWINAPVKVAQGETTKSVQLTRALAQVNFGSSDEDITTAASMGINLDYTAGSATTSKIAVTFDAPGKLNLLTNEAEEVTSRTVTFDSYQLPEQTDRLVTTSGSYTYVGTCYVPVDPAGVLLDNVELSMNVLNEPRSYTNIPVRRNYRTNILGNILTSTSTFTVELVPASADYQNIIDGVNIVMPAGVTAQDIVDNGGVACVVPLAGATRAAGDVLYPVSYKDALEKASGLTDGAAIYFLPFSNLSGNAHMGTTIKHLVIYANGSDFGGKDLAIDTYDNLGLTSSKLTEDQTIEIYDARNLYIWGSNKSDVVRTIKMTNCHNEGTSAVKDAGRMLYLSSAVGTTHVTLENCSVTMSDSPVYCNASGSITLRGCTFTDCAVPVNINYKALSGTQEDVVENCTFVRCGCAPSMSSTLAQYAAPMRFVKADASKDLSATTLNLTIRNCIVTGTLGSNGDVLLTEFRSGYKYWPVNIVEIQDDLFVINEPLQISNVKSMLWFADQVNSGSNTFNGRHVELAADIDLAGIAWQPIGPNSDVSQNRFRGTFDGKGHKILNLTVNQGAAYHAAGFFGSINGATIKDVIFENANVSSISAGEATDNGTAIVTGSIYQSGVVNNVKIINSKVQGNRYVGGISGYTYGTVTNCVVDGLTLIAEADNLTGEWDNGDKCGGICGYYPGEGSYCLTGNRVINSTIQGYRHIGSIAGYMGGDDGYTASNNTAANNKIIADHKHNYKKLGTTNFLAGELYGHSPKSFDGDNAENVTITLINHE